MHQHSTQIAYARQQIKQDGKVINLEKDNNKLKDQECTGKKEEEEPDAQFSKDDPVSIVSEHDSMNNDEETKQRKTFFIGDENDDGKCKNFYIGDEDEAKTKTGKGLNAVGFLTTITGKVDYTRYNFMNEHNAGDA